MLRAELNACVRGLRVAGPREPLALFTAQSATRSLPGPLAELGLRTETHGPLLVILPTPALAQALAARGECWAAGPDPAPACANCARTCAARALPRLIRACPCPAQWHQPRALMRELRALKAGWNEDDMALVARGLRLLEGPCDAAQRRTYARDVRRKAAFALRTGSPGDGLRACAYIMALGGITI